MSIVSTASGSLKCAGLSEDEDVLLRQVLSSALPDIAHVVDREPLYNSSGRLVDEHITITDEAWAQVQEALAASPDTNQDGDEQD